MHSPQSFSFIGNEKIIICLFFGICSCVIKCWTNQTFVHHASLPVYWVAHAHAKKTPWHSRSLYYRSFNDVIWCQWRPNIFDTDENHYFLQKATLNVIYFVTELKKNNKSSVSMPSAGWEEHQKCSLKILCLATSYMLKWYIWVELSAARLNSWYFQSRVNHFVATLFVIKLFYLCNSLYVFHLSSWV